MSKIKKSAEKIEPQTIHDRLHENISKLEKELKKIRAELDKTKKQEALLLRNRGKG